jgi:hypothetical protein
MHMELLMTVLEQCQFYLPFLSLGCCCQLLVVIFGHDNNYLPKKKKKKRKKNDIWFCAFDFVYLIYSWFLPSSLVSQFFVRAGIGIPI